MNDGQPSQLVPTLSSNPGSVANSEETIEDYWSAIEELVNSNTLQEQNTPSPTERPDLQLPDDIKAQVLFNFEAFMQNGGDHSDPWNIGSQLDPNNNEEKDGKDPSYMNALQALYNSGQSQTSPVAQTQPNATLIQQLVSQPSVVPQSSLVQQVSLAEQLTSPLAQQQSSPLVQQSPSLQQSPIQQASHKSLQQASLQQLHSPLQRQSPLQQASPAASTLTSSGAPDMSYFFYPQNTSENKPVVLPALSTSEELKLKIESPESLRSLLIKNTQASLGQSTLGDSFNRKVQFSLPTPDHTPEQSNSPPTTMPKLMSHSTMESVSSLLKLSSAHAVSDLMGDHKFLPSSTSTTSTASSVSGSSIFNHAPMDLTFLTNNHQSSADESMFDDEPLGESSLSAETPSRLITDDELISFSVRDLNRRLASATKAEAQQAKKRRRLLKNRGYAAICRTKRITHAQQLQTENNYLKELCQRLLEERDIAVSERNVVKEKYENLKLMIRKAKKVQKEKLQNPQLNSTSSTTEL